MDLIDGIYIATDTTGIPDQIPGWEPRLVAVGIATVEKGVWAGTVAGLILQDDNHLNDPRAARAREVHRLSNYEIQAKGAEPEAFFKLVEGLSQRAHGFNVPFLRHFLPGLDWGMCVMDEAARTIKGPAEKRIALNAALEWALQEGYDVSSYPNLETYRVGGNATRVAKLAIALSQEKKNA